MFLAVVAVLTVATLATLANTRTAGSVTESKANNDQGQAAYSSYTRYNEATMHFVN